MILVNGICESLTGVSQHLTTHLLGKQKMMKISFNSEKKMKLSFNSEKKMLTAVQHKQ